jgi:hypothetical protein
MRLMLLRALKSGFSAERMRPSRAAAPLDGDDVVDEVGFEGVERHVGVLKIGLEAPEFFFVLVREEKGFVGGESVFERILGGTGLALFGAGSGRMARVLDIGGDLSVR